MEPDYTFARRPRWLVGHLVATSAIVLFVILGMWQLSRHQDRSELDALLESRIAAEPLSFEAAAATPIEDLELSRVAVVGMYVPSEEVILQARSYNGRSGHNVITPLLTANGEAVLVNRGWVPIDTVGPPVVDGPPPSGEVSIVGVARKTEVRGSLGPVDPAQGTLERISRVDIERLEGQVSSPLVGFYLQLIEPSSSGELPLTLPAPEPGGGPPHLSYAVQWFLFAGVVLVGYPLLMRSTARKRQPQD
ncbi:MAG: SURF1 family protein [Acidimicrobiia bacterium]|nr:SURF1 family protein [Acidimicrobiia bacterium]